MPRLYMSADGERRPDRAWMAAFVWSSSLVFARFGVCPLLGVENLVLRLQDSRGVPDALGAPLAYRPQGQHASWRGEPARTFRHFVLSQDPGDDIDLAALREHAIAYHDDNVRGIPHAHIVVNNANLRTGYRMQTKHPEDLNRDL